MNRAVALVGLYLILGHIQPAAAAEARAAAAVTIPADSVGRRCEVALSSDSPRSSKSAVGKIVRFDNKSVVLADATHTVITRRTVWVLGRIPALGRLFNNVAVGVDELPGELTIARGDIKSVKMVE